MRNSVVKHIALYQQWSLNVHEISILETHTTTTTIVTNSDQPIDLYNTEISVITLWLRVIEKIYWWSSRRCMVGYFWTHILQDIVLTSWSPKIKLMKYSNRSLMTINIEMHATLDNFDWLWADIWQRWFPGKNVHLGDRGHFVSLWRTHNTHYHLRLICHIPSHECPAIWCALLSPRPLFFVHFMGLLPDTYNSGLCMHRECRERFPRQRLQRKLLVSDPGTHHGTCVTHVP